MGLLLSTVLLGGCYHYVPPDTARLERGDPVRAQVSGVPVEVGGIAIRDVTRVDGELVSLTDNRVILSATWLASRTGREFDGFGSTVAIDRGSLEALLEKRLDVLNTSLTVAAFTAGAALLHSILSSAGGVSGGGSNGGGNGTPK